MKKAQGDFRGLNRKTIPFFSKCIFLSFFTQRVDMTTSSLSFINDANGESNDIETGDGEDSDDCIVKPSLLDEALKLLVKPENASFVQSYASACRQVTSLPCKKGLQNAAFQFLREYDALSVDEDVRKLFRVSLCQDIHENPNRVLKSLKAMRQLRADHASRFLSSSR